MAGLEHEMAAGRGRGRLRASDADRERVIDTLKAAYVYGLVTKDEFDARASQAFASRTRAELTLVTADLPAGQQPPWLARARGHALAGANVRPSDRAIMATAIVAGLAWVAAVFAGPVLPLAGPLALSGTVSALVSLLLLGIQMRSRRTRRPGGQLPPQRGVDPGPAVADALVVCRSAWMPGAGPMIPICDDQGDGARACPQYAPAWAGGQALSE